MTANLDQFSGQLLLVGCGNMAGAMLDRWLADGLPASNVTIIDPVAAPRDAIRQFANLGEWAASGASSTMIMLGMKPQQLSEVADDLAPHLTADTQLLSILAGVSLADLIERFPAAGAHIRVLPNMAARIGAGVTALAPSGAADTALLDALMQPLGEVLTLADDSSMDLITAFTSSGPAFVFRMIEAYAAAGERLGLTADDSLRLANATFAGASALLGDSGEKPATLVAQVASKGGTTQAGLDVLEVDGQLAALFTIVLRAARDRGRELADLARG